MQTPTPTNRNHEASDADRARAERIAAAVVAAIAGKMPEQPDRLSVLTTAVSYWLAPTLPFSESERALARASQGIIDDAITNATARLIANESTPVDPIAEAAAELARFVEDHEEEIMEDFAALYVPALAYRAEEVEWERIARIRLGGGGVSYSLDALHSRIVSDVLGIFAEMDEVSASQRDEE